MAGATNKKTVMAFGAFDGVHLGHIHYLSEARKLGDSLVVAVSPDKSEWKFPIKYSLPEKERIALVEWLGIADKAILGSTMDPLEKIREINPAIVAITQYSPAKANLLQSELASNGLRAKVEVISPYKPQVYGKLFGRPSQAGGKEEPMAPQAANAGGEKNQAAARRKAGASGLEQLLSKELAAKDARCILVETGEEGMLRMHLAAARTLTGMGCSVITLSVNRPYSILAPMYKNAGVDPDKMLILDCVTGEGGSEAESMAAVLYLGRAPDLTAMLISITEALNRLDGRRFVIVDSVPALNARAGGRLASDFIRELSGRAKASGAGCLLLSSGPYESELVRQMAIKVL